MLVPGNRRNPVRAVSETALMGAMSGYNMIQKLATLLGEAKKASNAVGGIVKGVRKSVRRRRSNGILSSRPQSAPVTLGFTVTSNRMGSYRQCSFAGMRGTKISGQQIFCYATVGGVLAQGALRVVDAIESTHMIATNPTGIAAVIDGNSYQVTNSVPDPLFSLAAVNTRYRFTKIRFVFVPQRGTGETCQYTLGWIPDPLVYGGAYATPSEVASLEQSVTFPVWQEASLDVSQNLPMDRLLKTDTPSFNNEYTGNQVPNLMDYFQGYLVAQAEGATASTVYGKILIDFEIEVFSKRPFPDGLLELLTLRSRKSEAKSFDELKVPESSVIPPAVRNRVGSYPPNEPPTTSRRPSEFVSVDGPDGSGSPD